VIPAYNASETIKEKWGITQGLYYEIGRDMEGLALSLQNGLQEILRKNPPPIKK
jgi:hypothetical protein